MTSPKQPKQKKVKKYTGEQIAMAISKAFREQGHDDDWGVRVIYKDTLIEMVALTLLDTPPKKKTK